MIVAREQVGAFAGQRILALTETAVLLTQPLAERGELADAQLEAAQLFVEGVA